MRGIQLNLAAYTSAGCPKMNLGTNHCGLRIDIQTLSATRAVSTATSQAEFPAPTIKTLLPRHSSVTPLKSCECMSLPSK